MKAYDAKILEMEEKLSEIRSVNKALQTDLESLAQTA